MACTIGLESPYSLAKKHKNLKKIHLVALIGMRYLPPDTIDMEERWDYNDDPREDEMEWEEWCINHCKSEMESMGRVMEVRRGWWPCRTRKDTVRAEMTRFSLFEMGLTLQRAVYGVRDCQRYLSCSVQDG